MNNQSNKSKFQNFENPSDNTRSAQRLASLRALMKEQNLDIWLVPHADEHQNEYPPAHAMRLSWLSGFSGSAGYLIVTHDEAILFVDGRYTLQVKEQIDLDYFTPGDLVNHPPHKWLSEWATTFDSSPRIGYDPWLITLASRKIFKKSLPKTCQWVSCKNLIDDIWHDQPHPPLEHVSIHDEKYSGRLALHKLEDLRHSMKKENADLCVISDPASIAWGFNIRGGDTPHTPLPLGYAILRAEGNHMLFMDKRKMSKEVEAYLTQLADLHPPSRLDDELAAMVDGLTVMAQDAKISCALADVISASGGQLINRPDPITLPRAIKNKQEIEGSHNAHLRDGVALAKFLFWLDQQKPGTISEIDAVEKLEQTRATTAKSFQSELMEISFDTISGAGANGAIVHYRVTSESNATLDNNSLYLVDSGAQYQDGTTDITRTIAIGTPPTDAIEDFTLVLKGHIALALAKFPEGTRGVDLDCLARNALWQYGRDYAHGTGHGIGSYLSVHEGPQSISKRGMAELKAGMIISNEPGFYREGQYGIRIENLVLVKPALEFEGGNTPVMAFETLSMAPIDLRLIDPALLNENEFHWLNAYHGWVKRMLSPHLDEAETEWLNAATKPISNELPAASA